MVELDRLKDHSERAPHGTAWRAVSSKDTVGGWRALWRLLRFSASVRDVCIKEPH